MQHIKLTDAQTGSYYDDAVQVTEFHFQGDGIINDAGITITGRYPDKGYAVNDSSTALVSVESGEGFITIKDAAPQQLQPGDRTLIHPGEAYCFEANSELAIRYIATPAWTPAQARTIKE